MSPVGVTLKINHLQRCRWFFHFRHGKQFRNNFADSYLVEVINITTFGGRKFPPVGIVRHYLTGSIRISTKRGIHSGYPFFLHCCGLGECLQFFLLCLFRSHNFENHAVAVENQHPVPTGIAAFGSVLCFAFGSDADTAEICSLESRSDQRQVAALGYIYLLFHSVSC